MPAKGQQEQRLSERVVKEAITVGMETPMRETILEAVEESEGTTSGPARLVPLAGALVGIGAGVGYLLGTKGAELGTEDVSLESVDEPEVIDEFTGTESDAAADETDEEQMDAEEGKSGSRLRRLVLALGIVGAIALVRRRMQSSDEDEWEPIDEFETTVMPDEDEAESESDDEAAAQTEDTDEEREDEMTAGDDGEDEIEE